MKAESRPIMTIESVDPKSTAASRSDFTYFILPDPFTGAAGTTNRESFPTVSPASKAGTSGDSAGTDSTVSSDAATAAPGRAGKDKQKTTAKKPIIYSMRDLKGNFCSLRHAKVRKNLHSGEVSV